MPLDFDWQHRSVARYRDGLKIRGYTGHCGWRKRDQAFDTRCCRCRLSAEQNSRGTHGMRIARRRPRVQCLVQCNCSVRSTVFRLRGVTVTCTVVSGDATLPCGLPVCRVVATEDGLASINVIPATYLGPPANAASGASSEIAAPGKSKRRNETRTGTGSLQCLNCACMP
jgi:hypothetical protein